MSSLEECFGSGQLRKTVPDLEKAKASLRIAENKIRDAKIQFDARLYDWAFIAAYTAMFHCSRAILFKDGVKERSHFCLCMYIREKYRGVIETKYLNELDILREQRHAIMYGDENVRAKEVLESEADSAIKIAGGFLEAVKKLVNGNNGK